jgi:hypothetical protein
MPAEVQRLEQALRELLSLLEDPTSEGLAAAWERCRQAEAEVLALLEAAGELPEAEREALRGGVERALRLNAVARQAVVRGQDGLAAELVDARRKHAQVRGYSAAAPRSGGTCDMAG